MKIPLVEMLKNRGVHQGLGQTSNSIKMAALILLPLIVPWFIVQIFFTKAEANLYTPIVFGGWIACVVIYFFAKKAAASEYSVFPQSGWQFDDGQQIRYDIFVLPNRGEGQNGWEPITDNKGKPIVYSDGSQLYKVTFKDKLAYQDPKRDLPDIFNQALWKLPSSWTDSFDFNGFGEVFFEGIFTTLTKCENIEVTVIDWDERAGSRIPICLISSCSWYHKMVRNLNGKAIKKAAMTKMEAKDAVIAETKMRNNSLATRNKYVEQEAEEYSKHEPETIKKLADDRLAAIAKRHGNIMNAKKPVWTRILNMKNLILLGVTILIVVIIFYIIGML